jgi:hypothetical protein
MEPLSRCLTTLAEDLAFVTLSTAELDAGTWADVAKRRAPALDAELRGAALSRAATLDPWLMPLVRALAPVAEIRWMPMRELSHAITLHAGARGVRSLFSSKPTDKDVDRVRHLGALGVRIISTIMEADGARSATEQRLVWSFVASLGLGEADEAALSGVRGAPPESIEVPAELEPKMARKVVQGAWLSAIHDGLDPRDEGAVATVSNRLGVPMQEVGALGVDVKKESEHAAAFGRASASALAYVLRDQPGLSGPLGTAAITLLMPEPFRADAVAASVASPTPALPDGRGLERAFRSAVLGFAWAGAIATDPAFSRRAILAARHDAVADAISAGGDATKVRETVERMIAAEIERLAKLSA